MYNAHLFYGFPIAVSEAHSATKYLSVGREMFLDIGLFHMFGSISEDDSVTTPVTTQPSLTRFDQ